MCREKACRFSTRPCSDLQLTMARPGPPPGRLPPQAPQPVGATLQAAAPGVAAAGPAAPKSKPPSFSSMGACSGIFEQNRAWRRRSARFREREPAEIRKKVYPEGFVMLGGCSRLVRAPAVGKSVFGGGVGELRWWRKAAGARRCWRRWLMVVVCRRSLPQITPEGALPAELGAYAEAENGVAGAL